MVLLYLLLGLLFLLLFLFIWLLIARLGLRIDTRNGQYWMQIGSIASVTIIPTEALFDVQLRILFFRKRLDPLALILKRQAKKKPKKQAEQKKASAKKRSKKKRNFRWFLRILAVLRSFRVRQFQVYWDTDDFVWNAYLFPIVYMLTGGKQAIQINFQGKNEADIWMENRLIWMVIAFLRKPRKLVFPFTFPFFWKNQPINQ